MKPGTPIPEETRRDIWERCGGKCEYCGKKAIDPHHIIYRSHGGDNKKENIVALCRTCHDDVRILQKIAKDPKKYIRRYKW